MSLNYSIFTIFLPSFDGSGFKLYELQANNQIGFEDILAEKRASLEARIDKIREEIAKQKAGF